MTIDGEPWFVLGDICAVLDLRNSTMVAERLDPLTLSQAEVENARGQLRRTVIVNESGMYEVVIRSDKPGAVVFRRWPARSAVAFVRVPTHVDPRHLRW